MNQFFNTNLNEKDIYVFGAGNRGKKCVEILLDNKIKIKGIFDNNYEKKGLKIRNVMVQKPRKIENIIIIITVFGNYEELTYQLIDIGYSLESIITYEAIMLYIDEKKRGICKFPSTLQLPITHLCNFDCVMCGMGHMIMRRDFLADELANIIKDKLFSQIESVGINGGEPFLKEDLVNCVKVLVDHLPRLKAFYIITNGYFTDKIVDKMSQIKKICDKKNIKVNVSISIDGIGKIQDFHRGKLGAYDRAIRTLDILQYNKDKYADSLDIVCTVTRHNVFYLNEMVQFGERRHIDIAYNIATENVRIENMEKLKNFSVLVDEQARMVASEFFYYEYQKTGNEKYFGLFIYLTNGKRYTSCPCMYNEWITLTPDSEISFCATQSKKLGSVVERSAYAIVEENINYLNAIKENKCGNCSHYGYKLNSEGCCELFWNSIKNNYKYWRRWK